MHMNIIDQQSDRSHALLYKIAASMKSPELFTNLIAAVNTEDLVKEASAVFADEYQRHFPLNSPDNTVLSALYFNHQKEKYPDGLREKVASRIDTYLNLHDIPDSLFELAETEKVAEEPFEEVYLLPQHQMCKVAGVEDIHRAGEVFENGHTQMSLFDRVEFSRNFLKVAGELGLEEFPAAVAKYASVLDSDLNNTRHLLEARAAAAARAGVDGSSYVKLAEAVSTLESDPSKEELEKMAWLIHQFDETTGLDQPKYDSKHPDAFGVVFNKQASDVPEVDPKDAATKHLTKAEIIGRFGEDSLEELEDEDGTVNKDRLEKLTKMYGRKASASE